ncbi:hypothetical protein [Duganella sp. Root1480D1]|uniref:hypothetical protein n=1 Tax=Duganella sp. Root1480D1 TaxID=1736471 RepID=UPI0007100B67|nr:hypothetical protein [Duganella sp. Root1480D1]KQZ44283.1 hypothetical protein ASD58_18960 [Duganella sp. Root1480D1]
MIDFSSLHALAGNDSDRTFSFVGIRDGILHLPKGCDDWAARINGAVPAQRYALSKEAFRLLFHALEAFRAASNSRLKGDRDSAQRGPDGTELLGQWIEDEPIIYYRQLDILDGILERFDELEILTLAQRQGRSERVDGSRLYRELERATFTDDHSFFVDGMTLPSLQLSYEPVELVQMYCFALLEVKRWLGEAEDVHRDIQVLAAQFVELHLKAGDSLFEFDSWKITRALMLERLDAIDRTTAYKDPDYFDFYDALERFLRGGEQLPGAGLQWGISTFAPVWEAMCIEDLMHRYAAELAACDVSNVRPSLVVSSKQLQEVQSIRSGADYFVLRSMPLLKGAFEANEDTGPLFPDAVLLFSEDAFKQSAYLHYGVKTLADDVLPSSIPADFRASFEKLRETTDGYIQNDGADLLRELLKHTQPDGLTAFYMGRTLSNSYQVQMSESWSRQRLTKALLARPDAAYFADFIRGMLWEIVFDKSDARRSEDGLYHRKRLDCCAQVLGAVKSYRGTLPEMASLERFYEACIAGATEALVVDMKYHTSGHMLDAGKVAELRERSVRKQFVYEYRLQKTLAQGASIASEFCLPAYDPEEKKTVVSVDGASFAGGFISLRYLNVRALLARYGTELTTSG